MDDDAPLPARGAYNIDFDNLDGFDPFATKTKVTNNFSNSIKEPLSEKKSNDSMNVCHPSRDDQVNNSLHSSPDENKNPNVNVPSSYKSRRKPIATKTSPDKPKSVKKKDGGPPKQSLKDKIAEMRKKKEQEKKEQQVPVIDIPNDDTNNILTPSYLNNLPVQRKGSGTNPSDINLPESAQELVTPPRSPRTPRGEDVNGLNETAFKTPCASEAKLKKIESPFQEVTPTLNNSESMSILKVDEMEQYTEATPIQSVSNSRLSNQVKSNKNSSSSKPSPIYNNSSRSIALLPKIDQNNIKLVKIVSNTMQRDVAIYEQALERYQANRERTLKEANDRADIEEEYNQIKHRYDKLRDNQKKSDLPNIRNTVIEESKRNENNYKQAIAQNLEAVKDFVEYKRGSNQKAVALQHELTILKGKLKINDQKQNFQERKIAAQDDQIRNLQEEVEILKQEKVAMEADNRQMKTENTELAQMVEELMQHHQL